MSPSRINTKPERSSSESSSATSSTASSPTSLASRSSISRSATEPAAAAHGSGLLGRLRGSRPRSPAPPPASGLKRASTDSARSTRSDAAAAAASVRPRAQKRNSGTTMQVGRHSNDWLFGGFSFTEAVKDLLRNEDCRN